MSLDQLLAFNAVLLAAILSPGPAFLLLIRTALAEGRRAGIATGIGLALMASTWTLCALLGLSALFALVPWLYMVVKIAGALYLLHLAIKTWRAARTPLSGDVRPAHHALREGILVNALNPKSVMFSAAVLVVVFPAEISLAAKAVVVANHLIVEIVAYGGLAVLLSTPAISARYLGAKLWFDRVAALTLGALGLRLLMSRAAP